MLVIHPCLPHRFVAPPEASMERAAEVPGRNRTIFLSVGRRYLHAVVRGAIDLPITFFRGGGLRLQLPVGFRRNTLSAFAL
jgi:hypothetical protein